MDYLWTPWRYQYISQAIAGQQPDCIFCDAAERSDDEVTLVVHRGVSCFAILNRYPYTSGHLMIVPYAHVAELSLCEAATLTEMMRLAQRLEAALKALYKPDGMNFGMNLGRAAGAGITGPGFANRLRPKADFGGSRGYAGRSRRVEFVTRSPLPPHGGDLCTDRWNVIPLTE
jgi:ATP adenylyltransferase